MSLHPPLVDCANRCGGKLRSWREGAFCRRCKAEREGLYSGENSIRSALRERKAKGG